MSICFDVPSFPDRVTPSHSTSSAFLRALLGSDMTITEVFSLANLSPYGPVPWGTKISEARPGIYIVALAKDANACLSKPMPADYLDADEHIRWLANEPVVYIGRTEGKLKDRLSQFYRHKYGKSSPHRGGQAIKLLKCDLWVFWSPTVDPVRAEQAMIAGFEGQFGHFPFANRRH
jgi:hypothetical protein